MTINLNAEAPSKEEFKSVLQEAKISWSIIKRDQFESTNEELNATEIKYRTIFKNSSIVFPVAEFHYISCETQPKQIELELYIRQETELNKKNMYFDILEERLGPLERKNEGCVLKRTFDSAEDPDLQFICACLYPYNPHDEYDPNYPDDPQKQYRDFDAAHLFFERMHRESKFTRKKILITNIQWSTVSVTKIIKNYHNIFTTRFENTMHEFPIEALDYTSHKHAVSLKLHIRANALQSELVLKLLDFLTEHDSTFDISTQHPNPICFENLDPKLATFRCILKRMNPVTNVSCENKNAYKFFLHAHAGNIRKFADGDFEAVRTCFLSMYANFKTLCCPIYVKAADTPMQTIHLPQLHPGV